MEDKEEEKLEVAVRKEEEPIDAEFEVIEPKINLEKFEKAIGKMKELSKAGAEYVKTTIDGVEQSFSGLASIGLEGSIPGIEEAGGQLAEFQNMLQGISLDEFRSFTGDLGNLFNGMMGPIGTGLETTAGFVQVWSEQMGGSFAPILGKAMEFVPSFVSCMNIGGQLGIITAGLGLLYGAYGTQIDSILEMMTTQGPQIISSLCNGIITALPGLMEQGALLLNNFMLAVTANLPALLEGGIGIISTLISGIASQLPMLIPTAVNLIMVLFQGLITNLPMLIEAGLQLIAGLAQGIINALPVILESVALLLLTIIAKIGEAAIQFFQSGLSWLKELASGIMEGIPNIKDKIHEILTSIKDKFTNTNWGELGKNIISGIVDGLSGAAKHLLDAAAKAATDALNWVKEKLGIHSPSRVFRDQVGKMMALGMGDGFSQNIPIPRMEKGLDRAMHALKAETMVLAGRIVAAGLPASFGYGMNYGGNSSRTTQINQTVNIHQPVKSPVETARELRKAGRVIAFG